MSDFHLDPAEAEALAARIERRITGWTWPEILRALASELPPAVADEAAQALLGRHRDEPDEPEAALLDVLGRWVAQPRVVVPEPSAAVGPLENGLPEISTFVELAEWLDLDAGELEWFADHGGWLRRAEPRLRHYRHWTRAKPQGGVRLIEAPKPRLREIQRRILHDLVARISAHPAAKGFLPGTSVAEFARPHAGKQTVLRADLRHCFESIGVAQIRGIFRRAGYGAAVAVILADLCTAATPPDIARHLPAEYRAFVRQRHLPQGAPTSPHLSNLRMRGLDRRLAGFAAANGLEYTRYGDDLALSGDEMDSGRALWVLLRVIADEGFVVHAGKVRVMRAHQRQSLAGLVVNEAPRVARTEYDALRALLHNARRDGAAAQNRDGHPDFRAHVLGRIAWVGAGSPARRERLLAMARKVDWDL